MCFCRMHMLEQYDLSVISNKKYSASDMMWRLNSYIFMKNF